MKICHMTSAHSNNDTRVFEKECSSLAKIPTNDVYLVVKGDSFIANNVHIIGVGSAPDSRLKRMTSFAKKVYKEALKLDADIYHFHDPELIPYGLKLKRKGKKVIFDSHENYYKQIKIKRYLPGWLALILARIYLSYESFAVKQFDAVISTCIENGVDYFSSKCKKSLIIDNYPILKERVCRKKLNDVFTICYMGGLAKSRCLYEMIEAAYKTGSKLVLAGNLSDNDRIIINQMEEKECIDYRGYLSKSEVYTIYTQCDAGFSLLKRVGQYGVDDNLPTKAYECMMYSLPVIISSDDYAKKMMKEKQFGVIVEPEDVSEICDAINTLKNTENNILLGENGRQLVEEKYNWSIEEKKLFDLYEFVFNH